MNPRIISGKTCLIYGGAGHLGRATVDSFNKNGWNTVSVDFKRNSNADIEILIQGNSVRQDVAKVFTALQTNCESKSIKLDAVVSVAGAWSIGDIKNESVFDEVEQMLHFNLYPSIAAAHVAARCLNDSGLLVITGAKAALTPTPEMIGYGLAKAATHHLVKSLAFSKSLPRNTVVVGVCPLCLDTPTNRAEMPDENFDNWTSITELSRKFVDWANGICRPTNGFLVEVVTNNRITAYNHID